MLLTLLAAEVGSPSFEAMGRRWLSRLADKQQPTLPELALAAQLLADVAEGRLIPSKATEPLTRAARGHRIG